VEIAGQAFERSEEGNVEVAIIHWSVHHQNTQRVAGAMAEAIGARLLTVSEARQVQPSAWELIGLGSGIFFGKHHPCLLEFAADYPKLPKRCFVFSTAGLKSLYWIWHRPLVRVLERRGCQVIGQFCAPGWDTVGPLKTIGGIHRGRPNRRDLQRAADFAKSMLDRMDG
jgi:flavodoxin